MTNKTQHSITLVNGGEYLTREGTEVKMSVDKYCKPGVDYHQFAGSNGFYYKTNGSIFSDREFEADIVSEVPRITLEHGKTYVTVGGERVAMKHRTTPVAYAEDYKFTGSNGIDYRVTGDFYPVWNTLYKDHIIVSEYKEPQVQPKLYTEAHRDIAEAYQDGLNVGSTFTTSELQSLTKMQSKVITALEAEILELKETAQYLGNCVGLVNRVNGLRKQIFNEITTKKKRLVKLVLLQTKMKRSK